MNDENEEQENVRHKQATKIKLLRLIYGCSIMTKSVINNLRKRLKILPINLRIE